MSLCTEEDVIRLISKDKWMMDILLHVKTLQLPDWWICAGFVRSKIWDTVHGFHNRTPLPDVDVVYFDPYHLEEDIEKQLEQKLIELDPLTPWSVKNEARMHMINQFPPFTSSIDAISKFPETATALGVSLDDADHVLLEAPCGIDDVLNVVLKPTPFFSQSKDRMIIFEKRALAKDWGATWHTLKIQK